jgi:hypothetical protein
MKADTKVGAEATEPKKKRLPLAERRLLKEQKRRKGQEWYIRTNLEFYADEYGLPTLKELIRKIVAELDAEAFDEAGERYRRLPDEERERVLDEGMDRIIKGMPAGKERDDFVRSLEASRMLRGVHRRQKSGAKRDEAVREVAEEHGVSKRTVYDRLKPLIKR